jgi:hypothetical protein
MKKLLRLLLGVLIVLAVGLTTAPAAQAATRPYCGIYWGSLVQDRRAGRPYACRPAATRSTTCALAGTPATTGW